MSRRNALHKERCAVIGIVFSLDRTSVLLIQRRDVPVWVLPGGGVDAEEAPEGAIVRELLEETGFLVQVTRLIGEYTPINRLTRHTFFYECQILSGTARPSQESRAVQFFPVTGLPPLVPPPHPDWIREALEERPFFVKPLTDITYMRLLRNFFCHPCLVIRFILSRLGCPINR